MAFFSFFSQQKARQKAVPTNTAKNISADKQIADTFLAMHMVLTNVRLLLEYFCYGLNVNENNAVWISLLPGSVARNKEKNLHNALKFPCKALHFQSQTVQSLQCLQCLQGVSRCLVSQCKSCRTFRSIVHFPSIKAVEEKNVCNSEKNLSASFTVIFANRGNQRSWLASLFIKSQQ